MTANVEIKQHIQDLWREVRHGSKEFAIVGLLLASLSIAHFLAHNASKAWWVEPFEFGHLCGIIGAVALFCVATIFRVGARNFGEMKHDWVEFSGNTGSEKNFSVVSVAILCDIAYSSLMFGFMLIFQFCVDDFFSMPSSAKWVIVFFQLVSLGVFFIVSIRSLLRLVFLFFGGMKNA